MATPANPRDPPGLRWLETIIPGVYFISGFGSLITFTSTVGITLDNLPYILPHPLPLTRTEHVPQHIIPELSNTNERLRGTLVVVQCRLRCKSIESRRDQTGNLCRGALVGHDLVPSVEQGRDDCDQNSNRDSILRNRPDHRSSDGASEGESGE